MNPLVYAIISAVICCVNVQAHIRIGIASASNYCGERELAWRIKIAGENLGWTVLLEENEGRQLQNIEDLDWVICLLPENPFPNSRCPNYLTIFHPSNYLNRERSLLPFYEQYDGYLLTIQAEKMRANKELYSIPFYPSVHSIPYQEVALNNLVIIIPVWGNRLIDPKFRILYKLLSRTGLVRFYGVERNADIIDAGYMGKIPFDGVSVIKVLQQHGITLVIHSDLHNEEGIPTSRIFEAAAASTVIISDENPFVKQHFGDSVFYINTSLTVRELYEQVLEHLNTIYADPEKALKMAKTAHQIFIDQFEMSDQLLKLEKLHQTIKSKIP